MKTIHHKVMAGLLSGMIVLSGMAMPAKGEAAYRIWPKTISWTELETMYQNYLQSQKSIRVPRLQSNKQLTGTTVTIIPVTGTPATEAPVTGTPATGTPPTGSQEGSASQPPATNINTDTNTNQGTIPGQDASPGNLKTNGYVLDLPGMAAYEKWMFDQVNMERQKLGIAPLQWEPTLNKLARMKSQDMVDKGYFAHKSPTYGSAVNMMAQAGLQLQTAGENLAVANRIETAQGMLMDSQAHRNNILNGNFTHVGIGVVKTASGGVMVTQMFIGR